MGKHHREPIKHTCPDIDKLIKGITEIQKLTNNYQKIDEIDDFKDIISDNPASKSCIFSFNLSS